MTIGMAAVFLAAGMLNGMKTLYGAAGWKGRTEGFSEVWTKKPLYVIGVCWAVVYMAVWSRTGPSLQIIRFMDLLFTYGLLSVVDLRCRRVPDSVLFCFFAGQMLLAATAEDGAAILERFLTGCLFALLLFLAGRLSGNRMGMGDVKLLAATAVTAGWRYTLQIVFMAMLAALLYSIWLLLFRHKNTKEEFPFVPFLTAGILFCAICGA